MDQLNQIRNRSFSVQRSYGIKLRYFQHNFSPFLGENREMFGENGYIENCKMREIVRKMWKMFVEISLYVHNITSV